MNAFSRFKIIIIIVSILIYILLKYKYKKNENFKVCLCTLGKKENNYAVEFVEHYKRYGIDKIFIYDNNDINGEKFQDILYNYIKQDLVQIIDYRGKYKIQLDVLNHCYKNNYKIYNWLILFDMDEFIFLNKINNVKIFLKNDIFKKCRVIFLNEVVHTDNNQIYYKKGKLIERFKEIEHNLPLAMVKPIIKGNIENLIITNNHVINLHMEGCNAFGEKARIKGIHTNDPDRKYYYFDHYYFKSSEEYLNKLSRGSCYWGNLRAINFMWLNKYFRHNKITLEKLNYFEKKTSVNLTIFRNQLKQKKFNLNI